MTALLRRLFGRQTKEPKKRYYVYFPKWDVEQAFDTPEEAEEAKRLYQRSTLYT